MKVAIPIWNDRVSPVMDTSTRLLVVEVVGEEESSREEHLLTDEVVPLKVRRLKELGVDVLVCGAVSNPCACLIQSAGIKLIPWVSGNLEDVLNAFNDGKLTDPQYLMPGCGGRKRHMHGGGRRRGSGGVKIGDGRRSREFPGKGKRGGNR